MIIKTSKDEIESYLVDASNYKGNCDKLCIPESESEIVDILKNANKSKTRITISGGGTGLTGGRVPESGLLLSTERMNKILSIDKESKTITVEPGVYLKDLQKEVESLGLFYPPDPTEKDCFIGGTIATNASGARSFKYGATRNYVEELRVVLVNGNVLNLKRCENFAKNNKLKLETENKEFIEIDLPNIYLPKTTKHAAGYYINENMDAIDLFIGSEGTLGIVTKIKLRLLDKSKNLISLITFFNSEDDALSFIDDARNVSNKVHDKDGAKIEASCLEYFDEHSLNFIRDDFSNITKGCKAAVWFEQAHDFKNDEALLEAWFELILKHNGNEEDVWFASDKKDLELFKRFRHSVSAKANEYISSKGISKVGTDTSVPHSEFRAYLQFMKNIVEEKGINYIVYGHAGDSHLHLNMLPRNEEEFKTAKNLYEVICKQAVELGGTISAEHGIGKLKREYFYEMYGEESIKSLIEIKKAFDPNLILNVGNLFYEEHLC